MRRRQTAILEASRRKELFRSYYELLISLDGGELRLPTETRRAIADPYIGDYRMRTPVVLGWHDTVKKRKRFEDMLY